MADHEVADVDAEEAYNFEPVHIDRLEIENFKSYKGHHRIGPFRNFTAVIGPNGSGKSNLMDAISFVLGVKTGQLRGNLKELLYLNTSSKDPEDFPKRGYVKLVMLPSSGEDVALSRWIQPGPGGNVVSVYKIDDKQVTFDEYTRKLASYGILVKVKNFLVFQGDIESVAQKSPLELTKLFEQISGSEALAEKFEECKRVKEEAESLLQLMFSKKKNVQAEKTAKRKQKEEAERYLRTQQELKDTKGLLLRYRLKCHKKDIEAAQAVYEQQSAQIQELEQQHAEFDAKMQQTKEQQATVAKKRLQKDRERQKWTAQLDKKAPELASIEAEVKSLEKKANLERKSYENHMNEEMKLQKKLKKLEKDMEKVKADLKSIAEETESSEGSLNLSTAALEEYNSIKTQVQTTTSALQTELKRKENELENLKEELANLNDRTQSAAAEKDRTESQLKELQGMLQSKKATVEELQQTLTEKKVELNKLQDQHRKCRAKSEDLNAKMENTGKQMDELKQERRESERDRKITQAVEELKERFPGVAGRMTELGRMPQQKYRLAITMAMQRDVDSVVVDSKRTCMQCLEYLRAPGKPRINFIPLDSVKTKPIDERLRHLGGTSKLAIDLLEFDHRFERAFIYALGNTLVCDSSQEGQHLAFNGPERHKVVTTEGVLYSKSGAITGGISTAIEGQANKWDEQKYQELKRKMDQLHAEQLQLPNLRTMQENQGVMTAEVNALEGKLVYERSELERAERRIPIVQKNLQKAIEAANKQMGREGPLSEQMAALEVEIDKMKKRVAQVADAMFADFSKKMNIANIREYEENSLKAAQELRKRKSAAQDQESKLSTQIKFDSTALEKSKRNVQAKRDKIEECTKKIEQLHAKLETQTQEKQKLEQDIAQAKQDIQAFRDEEKTLDESVKELKDQEKEYLAVLNKHQRQLHSCENQMLHACKAAWSDFEDAAVAQISLRAEAEEEGEAGPSTATGNGAGPSRSNTEDQTATAGTEDFSGLPAVEQAAKALEQLAHVDFDKLRREHQAVKGKAEREKVVEHYQARMSDLQSELEKNPPNLKAVEQFVAIQEKERKQAAELDQARTAANRATTEFEKVRQMRLDKFTAAFDDVSKSIDEIYKQLTTSRVHPMGGQAFLSLENPEEPFNSGIKYTAMPPTKRFRDMESLSGGEKTMAAVALLFSIHRYRPSPFFVLDEVDAALDRTNVSRLAHYIRNNTRNDDDLEGQFQSIVISLKDNFFEKADALVGVSRDAVQGCSKVFTLDLEGFGPPRAVDA